MSEKFIVQYRSEFYDISNFIHKHPGGINTLKGLENSDMTERFIKAPPHSDAAMYLMREYKQNSNENESTINGHKNGLKRLKQHDTNEISNKVINMDLKNQIETDESMEVLIDWSKPMVNQIGSLGSKYTEWVNKPVDRPLRLFGPWYLEICTKTPWWLVPAFWIPIILYFYYSEKEPETSYKHGIKMLYLLIGSFIWTLVEYSLHRWVFHMKTEGAGRGICTFHFLMHGLHHKVPFDPYRLVFPPLPALVIASIIYIPVYVISIYPRLLLAGGLIGYLVYDLMHYYLHYGSPQMKHLYHMKRYHYQHHFVHHDMGFGISSPLWDLIFGTSIRLRKLKYFLKW